MKLNRAQEEILIQIGLETLLAQHKPIPEVVAKPESRVHKKPAWSDERRAKFSRTMKRRWATKRKEQQASKRAT